MPFAERQSRSLARSITRPANRQKQNKKEALRPPPTPPNKSAPHNYPIYYVELCIIDRTSFYVTKQPSRRPVQIMMVLIFPVPTFGDNIKRSNHHLSLPGPEKLHALLFLHAQKHTKPPLTHAALAPSPSIPLCVIHIPNSLRSPVHLLHKTSFKTKK